MKRRNYHKKKVIRCALSVSGAAVFILIACGLISVFWTSNQKEEKQKKLPQITMETKLLEPNEYSRPQLPLRKVKGVVVHYTANPGTDAIDNRNYFNNLPKSNEGKERKTYASSHFVIGLEGQIIQCIPLEEIAYASNDRNSDTISIGCCHPDQTGKFNQATYQALKELVVYLCIRYDLEAEDVIRHYDVTGKACPLYFVEHEDEWKSFLVEIEEDRLNQS